MQVQIRSPDAIRRPRASCSLQSSVRRDVTEARRKTRRPGRGSSSCPMRCEAYGPGRVHVAEARRCRVWTTSPVARAPLRRTRAEAQTHAGRSPVLPAVRGCTRASRCLAPPPADRIKQRRADARACSRSRPRVTVVPSQTVGSVRVRPLCARRDRYILDFSLVDYIDARDWMESEQPCSSNHFPVIIIRTVRYS
jgi:hypothetical protein